MTVAGRVDLRAQAAAGASERVVVGFGPVRRPLFGPGGMLVGPAGSGEHALDARAGTAPALVVTRDTGEQRNAVERSLSRLKRWGVAPGWGRRAVRPTAAAGPTSW